MSVSDLTLKQAPTSILTSGGTDIVFDVMSSNVPNQVPFRNFSNVEFRNREEIVTYSKPSASSNGIFGKDVNKFTIYVPRTYDEVYVKNLVRVQAEVHPGMTDEDFALMLDLAAQMLLDQRDFLRRGKLS